MKSSFTFHEDDRAQRFIDIFGILDGQVNVSFVHNTEHIVAWHRHEKQTDYWVCLKGSFKVGYVENGVCEFKYLSDKNPSVLEIPPNVYHGYKAIEPGSILLYYVTRKYDPLDEFRMEIGSFGEQWNTENK